jgi:uncharacterized membrane protein YtjA (UPF0391 family)
MLHYAVLFFILAIISLALGFYGIAGLSVEIGWILLVVFVVLSIVSAIVHIIRGRE